jgi:two-component system OmpR family sensor kinase
MKQIFSWLRTYWAHVPLRWRLTLTSLSLLACLFGIVGSFVAYSAEQTLLDSQARTLSSQTQIAEATWRIYVKQAKTTNGEATDTSFSAAQGAVIELFTDPTIQVAIYSPDGRILASSRLPELADSRYPQMVKLSPDQLKPGISQQSSDNPRLLIGDGQGQRHLILLYPLRDAGGQPRAILALNTLTTPVDLTMRSLRLILFLGILGALLIAAVCTFPLVNIALRPLVIMERTSARIATGNLSVRLDLPVGRDEIGRLARTFNHMVTQLETAFTRQKRFVADVSHELRTPLTALGGNMEMVLLGVDQGDPVVVRRLVRSMYAEIQRMQRLVVGLLILARLDEDQASQRKEPIELSALLTNVCQQIHHLARGQTILCDIANELPTLYGDADQLQRVLLNLAENALKYTPAPGSICISAQRFDQHTVKIAIQDSGIGIPLEDLPHIFDRFYRVDPARSRQPGQAGGEGLGLSIVRELVEAHGGTIEVNSTFGVGTTATILFPYNATGPD